MEKTKKSGLLSDLIESEKSYVDVLTGIIRKVAAAWSRSNLPPPELDTMFRSVEGVYKTNRILLGDIGENPASPKALGDLLMRWIDDLERPYTTYADKYCAGFDDWQPVKSNPKLSGVLETFSASSPPSSTMVQAPHLRDPSLWTLDALFILPKGRLQYYRKLYSKLLKTTTPGRSDHRLLTGALEKLDGLLTTLDDRAHNRVGESDPMPPPPEVKNETNAIPKGPSMDEFVQNGSLLSGQFGSGHESASTSMRGSSSSSGERLSRETEITSINRDSTQTKAMLPPVADLEKQLTTERTVDIFTMQPKQVRLQMAPPSLPYTRELRASVEVVIRFTPKATGVEVVHHHGHVYILSDLFLMCERMTPEERASRGVGGASMHLCYPPLSGKVLKVTDLPGQDNALQVSIMRKETLILEADSRDARDQIIQEFQECISFARTMSGAAQEPVPPLPPMGGLPQSPAAHLKTSGSPPRRERPERAINPRLISQPQPGAVEAERPSESQSPVDGNLAVSPVTSNYGLGVMNAPPSAFGPGQIIPPKRSTSIQSQFSPPSISNSDQMYPGPPGGVHSPPNGQDTPRHPSLRHNASMHSLRQQPSLHHQPSMHPPPQQPSLHHQPPMHSLHHNRPIDAPKPASARASLSGSFRSTRSISSLRQPFTPHPPGPIGSPHGMPPPRPPSEPSSSRTLQKSVSSRSLRSQYEYSQNPLPPVPTLPDGLPMPHRPFSQRKNSLGSLSSPILPSMQIGSSASSFVEPSIQYPKSKPVGPVRSVVSAQMSCKPTNVKQLVVAAATKDKHTLISTIVLTDGVERVGKTGVAIELSDAGGARTGIIYMIQLRNEDSASGLFKTLLAGSDRAM
ncbi:hypothetical protein BU15DRAFT_87438 [Melanogaster broomeanus]|nr:hypothetical protein BU15DRAFT_87438 [Melanogaster broomeanus]